MAYVWESPTDQESTMNEILEKRLYNLSQSDISDWVPERTARRGEEYRNRVGAIVSADDCLAARVRGTEEYTTNLFVDSYGEFVSVCSCPVGRNCKHGVALALCASEKLEAGETIPEASPEKWRLDRKAILASRLPGTRNTTKPPAPPSPPPVQIRVEMNPFDRFTPTGGRHGKDFSFRVEGAGEVFHWSFVISALIYLLAKGKLDYGKDDDPPLFTCSCGDPGCDGFWSETCAMTPDEVTLTVVQYGRTITFSFDRVLFEYWALLALRRMRGSARLRKEPGEWRLGREELDDYLETPPAFRPRCRAVWQRLKTKRRFDESDFAELAGVPPGDAPAEEVRKAFAPMFSGFSKTDLRDAGVLWGEQQLVAERLKENTVNELQMRIYGTLVGKRWQPTNLERGEEITFVREPADEKGRPVIRIADAATDATIGYLKFAEAKFLTMMMDRHGLILRNHVERFERNGKSLPIRIDFTFRNPSDLSLDWGAALDGKERLYFEMLRAVALKPGLVSAPMLRDEVERIGSIVREVSDCPEIAFLVEWLLSSVREIEYRLTEKEIRKRRAYYDAVRLACEPVGKLIAVGDVSVLPLKAVLAATDQPPDEIFERVRSWIRLSWTRHDLPRPHVALPEFPQEATGFAAFRGRDLLDVCLTGIPLAGSNLFDNFALYDRSTESPPFENAQEAFAAATAFLASLPIRERDKNGLAPHFWLEHGIHDGTYEIDEDGRLVALRIIRMIARKRWVD